MKKTLLTLISALFVSAAATAQVDVSRVTGTYTGELYVSLGSETYNDKTLNNSSAEITLSASSEDGKVDFSLPNFSYAGKNLGTITIPNIGLGQESSTHYTFEENSANLSLKWGVIPISATVNVNTTKSYIEADSIMAYVPVDAGFMGWIFVLFKGKNPTSGVHAVTTTTSAPAAIYDLQGRRVNATRSNLPAGLYIINGKKTLVR